MDNQPIAKDAYPVVSMVSRYIGCNCRRSITLHDLAELANMNGNYLSERFRAVTGLCLSAYIALCRVEHAKALLESSEDKLISVGRESGFQSEVTFYRTFQRIAGMTPGDYRDACKRRESLDTAPGPCHGGGPGK